MATYVERLRSLRKHTKLDSVIKLSFVRGEAGEESIGNMTQVFHFPLFTERLRWLRKHRKHDTSVSFFVVYREAEVAKKAYKPSHSSVSG
jgi:hypothetical protein